MINHLKAFLQYLALNRNASAHTVRAYDSDLTQFLAHAAAGAGVKVRDVAPKQLDRLALRGFLGDLHKHGRSRASAARKLAAARTFLRYLRREGLIDDDPGALVATPKRDVRMPAHLSEDEMSALIESPAGDTLLARRDRAILELFYASGLRLSELAGLDVDDVNLSAKMVRVLGKGGKERIVPFNSSAAKAVREYLKDRDARSCQPSPRRPSGQAGGPSKARSAIRQLPRRAADSAQCGSARTAIRRGQQHADGDQPARAAAFLRDASASARRRPARDPGTARPRAPQHDAALYARQFRAAARGLQEVASARAELGITTLAATSGAARLPRGNSMPSVLIL